MHEGIKPVVRYSQFQPSKTKEMPMPKYLLHAAYTSEGAKGLLKEGGTKRRDAVESAVKPLGVKIEAFYYSLGESDVYVIVDAPDNAAVAAVSVAVNSSGAVKLRTVVLLTAEEMDTATKKGINYRAPGA
jgi:uncharacterized protein with GYD domain